MPCDNRFPTKYLFDLDIWQGGSPRLYYVKFIGQCHRSQFKEKCPYLTQSEIRKQFLRMHGIKKCPKIIYRLKKYRETSTPRYFVASSIVDNFCKNPTMRIICSAFNRFSLTKCQLSAFGRGCHVAGIYVGVLMYADDLLLISSTCRLKSLRMR